MTEDLTLRRTTTVHQQRPALHDMLHLSVKSISNKVQYISKTVLVQFLRSVDIAMCVKSCWFAAQARNESSGQCRSFRFGGTAGCFLSHSTCLPAPRLRLATFPANITSSAAVKTLDGDLEFTISGFVSASVSQQPCFGGH